MRVSRHRDLVLLTATALAAAPACAPTSTGQGAAAVPAAPQNTSAAPAHTDADVEFVRHMIMHHAQALDMAALVSDRAENDVIRLLAERIEVSQRDEIAMMEQWLRNRGAQAGMDHPAGHAGSGEHAGMHARHHPAGGGTMMPGMMTPEEMANLAAATGMAFDRLFLESMIRHHEGALVMVAELFSTPGAGQEPEIYQLASEIDSDQRMEIERMRRLLDTLGG